MVRKSASKKEIAGAADVATAKRAANKKGGNNNAKSTKSFAATILPFLVVAFVLFFAVNRLYLMPQRAASQAAAAKAKQRGGSYLSRTEVVERKRIDVPCYVKKVLSMHTCLSTATRVLWVT